MKHQNGLGKIANHYGVLADRNFGGIDCFARPFGGARIVFLPHKDVRYRGVALMHGGWR
jgi:hypothetical protein